MNKYEIIYIIDAAVEEAPRKELIAKFSDLVTANGGAVEKVDEWGSLYNINDSTVNAAKASYNRTMALVGDGLTACQYYLAEARDAREAAYLAAVQPAA